MSISAFHLLPNIKDALPSHGAFSANAADSWNKSKWEFLSSFQAIETAGPFYLHRKTVAEHWFQLLLRSQMLLDSLLPRSPSFSLSVFLSVSHTLSALLFSVIKFWHLAEHSPLKKKKKWARKINLAWHPNATLTMYEPHVLSIWAIWPISQRIQPTDILPWSSGELTEAPYRARAAASTFYKSVNMANSHCR